MKPLSWKSTHVQNILVNLKVKNSFLLLFFPFFWNIFFVPKDYWEESLPPSPLTWWLWCTMQLPHPVGLQLNTSWFLSTLLHRDEFHSDLQIHDCWCWVRLVEELLLLQATALVTSPSMPDFTLSRHSGCHHWCYQQRPGQEVRAVLY